MFRISHMLVLLMAVWCAGLLVWTSQSVQKTERELLAVQYQKNLEAEVARVLLSEWEYLNRPSRLESLIEDYQLVQNKHKTEVKMLVSMGQIKTPIIPAVPRVKPDRFLHHVSLGHEKLSISPVRLNKEDQFSSVVNELLEGNVHGE